jgi:hypothetical protein
MNEKKMCVSDYEKLLIQSTFVHWCRFNWLHHAVYKDGKDEYRDRMNASAQSFMTLTMLLGEAGIQGKYNAYYNEHESEVYDYGQIK